MEPPEIVLSVAAAALRTPAEHLAAYPRDQGFFSGWRFWWVDDDCSPPSGVHVAEREGRAVVVRLDEGLGPLVDEEPVVLADAAAAVAYARWFVEVTSRPTVVIDHLGEIVGPIERAIAGVEAPVSPPVAARDGAGGWTVTLFLHELDWLERGLLRIAPDGRAALARERIGEGLSIFAAWE